MEVHGRGLPLRCDTPEHCKPDDMLEMSRSAVAAAAQAMNRDELEQGDSVAPDLLCGADSEGTRLKNSLPDKCSSRAIDLDNAPAHRRCRAWA